MLRENKASGFLEVPGLTGRERTKRVQRMTHDPETGWAHVQFRKQTIKTQCVDPDLAIKILNGIGQKQSGFLPTSTMWPDLDLIKQISANSG